MASIDWLWWSDVPAIPPPPPPPPPLPLPSSGRVWVARECLGTRDWTNFLHHNLRGNQQRIRKEGATKTFKNPELRASCKDRKWCAFPMMQGAMVWGMEKIKITQRVFWTDGGCISRREKISLDNSCTLTITVTQTITTCTPGAVQEVDSRLVSVFHSPWSKDSLSSHQVFRSNNGDLLPIWSDANVPLVSYVFDWKPSLHLTYVHEFS